MTLFALEKKLQLLGLSGSSDGLPVLLAQTATPGNALHNASGSADQEVQLVHLWLQNNHTADVVVTIEFGGTTARYQMTKTVPFKAGPQKVLDGVPLPAGSTIAAFAATANVVTAHGYVEAVKNW